MSPGSPPRPGAGRRLGWHLLRSEALLWIVFLRLALVVLPFRTVLRLTRPRGPGKPSLAPGSDSVLQERVAAAVTGASRLVPGTRCLPRALAGQALLRRRGIAAELKIGVARGAGGEGLQAHAWLEAGGTPLLTGGPLEPYTLLSGTARPSPPKAGS